jgi:hypothetical protein
MRMATHPPPFPCTTEDRFKDMVPINQQYVDSTSGICQDPAVHNRFVPLCHEAPCHPRMRTCTHADLSTHMHARDKVTLQIESGPQGCVCMDEDPSVLD